MRILYCAIDQTVPGTTGGSVHVVAVAEGLAALGHEVHVLAQQGAEGFPSGRAHWHELRPPLGSAQLRWMRWREVRALAKRFGAEIVLERYYNFGGEGMSAARAVGAIGVLEVNAPIIDYPGSPKAMLDRLVLAEPMRRFRDRQVRAASLLVTPSAAIVPAWVPRGQILEIEWGADTDRFRPDATAALPFTRSPAEVVAVFAGAFRKWHGAIHLVDAIKTLHTRGLRQFRGVFIGDGPELAGVRAASAGHPGLTIVGSVPHDQMPGCLAAADIGVAPFDLSAHPPLRLAFYWSPLKVFEYMATGLPVVAPNLPRLEALIGHHTAGLLYDTGSATGLADALSALADPTLRQRLGATARQRAVENFSWTAHCQRLDEAFRRFDYADERHPPRITRRNTSADYADSSDKS